MRSTWISKGAAPVTAGKQPALLLRKNSNDYWPEAVLTEKTELVKRLCFLAYRGNFGEILYLYLHMPSIFFIINSGIENA